MHELEDLRSRIAAVRRRWRAAAALRTAGLAAAATSVPLAAAAIVAWIVTPDGAALVALAALSLAAAVAVAVLFLRRFPQRPSDLTTARFIEEQAADLEHGRLDDGLVSAVQVAEVRELHGDAFAGIVVSRAARRLRAIPPEDIVTDVALRRSAFHAAAGIACLAAAIVVAMAPIGRAADATWLALFPGTIVIDVQPGDTRVVAGQPLRIRAALNGKGGTLRGVTPSVVVSADGQERTVPMSAAGGAYELAIESVDRSFAYKVTASKVTSKSYSVTALFPPRVRRIDLRYDYPDFSGLAPRSDDDGGDIYGPAGTRVRVRIHTDKPVTAGEIALTGSAAVPMRSLDGTGGATLEATLTLSKDDSYRVRLADGDGLRSRGDTEYFIRLMDDRPPEVRILRPSADQPITPLEEVAIEARADDDYGIARFELVYSIAGRHERTVPFRAVTGTNVARLGTYLMAAEDLRVQPGDVVTYYARAVDVGRGKRPTETRSDIFFLEVKPFGEEFVAAQSQAMGAGGAAAQQLESLIAAQKEIINATWNLERRAGAGRSADDAKAVAQAQDELRARAERMAQSGRRGFRNPYMPQRLAPQPQRERSTADPVGAAVQAMTRAVEQLQGERLREALPHEMSALQGLLQAQAEIRRRQVQQQSASGAAQGGTSRMGQDLSALFDRELQRQQRTNYESRSQVEERPDTRDTTSALDRIRDLARRQEDLSRRQEDLTRAGLSAEEMKRRLETLSREQDALRAEAERLEKELGSNDAKSSRGSAAAAGQASESMRGALEEMRRAAGEMKRQDAGAAAGRAQAAADALRRSEQQLRGTGADARQRQAGELQLEAQQVAEAQRRIAGEAARLQSSAPGTAADAQRRLAAEKDTLADRVDELQRAARQLGAQAGAAPAQDPGARAREAAAILDREQIGRRMRESARELRSAPGGTEGSSRRAQTEQEIARAVERAAAALGGRTADTQALTDELEQTRAMRDRLTRLEQQLRDAEARQPSGARSGRSSQTQAGSDGRQGREGRQGSTGSGQAGELQRLRDEYARELQRARESLGRLQGEQRSGQHMSTPETHEFSRSAPGTEAFKQDYSRWAALRKDIDLAMERYEAATSRRLGRGDAAGRLDAGGSDRVPDAYRRSIARYYESLARLKN